MNDDPNEKKKVFVLDKSNRENYRFGMKWQVEYLDETQPIAYQCKTLFPFFQEFISSYSASILQQYSLAYSESC